MQTVEQATQALWDYINSLPPADRERAIAYQDALETMGRAIGMNQAIAISAMCATADLQNAMANLLGVAQKVPDMLKSDHVA